MLVFWISLNSTSVDSRGNRLAAKQYHEIRDPIHVFVRLDSDERRVLDSGPVQRLRHIHQLAMSYLVYPGATHKRFEHSLGVMELAGKGIRRRYGRTKRYHWIQLRAEWYPR